MPGYSGRGNGRGNGIPEPRPADGAGWDCGAETSVPAGCGWLGTTEEGTPLAHILLLFPAAASGGFLLGALLTPQPRSLSPQRRLPSVQGCAISPQGARSRYGTAWPVTPGARSQPLPSPWGEVAGGGGGCFPPAPRLKWGGVSSLSRYSPAAPLRLRGRGGTAATTPAALSRESNPLRWRPSEAGWEPQVGGKCIGAYGFRVTASGDNSSRGVRLSTFRWATWFGGRSRNRSQRVTSIPLALQLEHGWRWRLPRERSASAP